MFTDTGEEGICRLLHRAADIRRPDLDVPSEVGQFQHRHHAIDRDNGNTVDFGMPGCG